VTTLTDRIMARLALHEAALAHVEATLDEQRRQPFPQRQSQLIEFLGLERLRLTGLIQELHALLDPELASPLAAAAGSHSDVGRHW
jgi:hypothetical protein